MQKRLLVVLAHPDDESFGMGSTLAKYTAEGVETTLICATSGDVGTVEPERLKGYDSISALRLAELECASKVLGLKEVVLFHYRDSGMMGSEDNKHPKSLWSAPDEQVAQQVLEVMRRVKPQVVITFDPFGAYGHPDHIKIHHATLAAFRQAQLDRESPQKLYYAAFPRLLLRWGVFVMRLTGKDPRHAGTNKDMDFQAVLDATLPTHTRINVMKYYEAGIQAGDCHASQGSPRRMFPLGQVLMKLVMGYASFTRAEPAPQPGERKEHDLFEGIKM